MHPKKYWIEVVTFDASDSKFKTGVGNHFVCQLFIAILVLPLPSLMTIWTGYDSDNITGKGIGIVSQGPPFEIVK
jgi:hypothetical protein